MVKRMTLVATTIMMMSMSPWLTLPPNIDPTQHSPPLNPILLHLVFLADDIPSESLKLKKSPQPSSSLCVAGGTQVTPIIPYMRPKLRWDRRQCRAQDHTMLHFQGRVHCTSTPLYIVPHWYRSIKSSAGRGPESKVPLPPSQPPITRRLWSPHVFINTIVIIMIIIMIIIIIITIVTFQIWIWNCTPGSCQSFRSSTTLTESARFKIWSLS